MAVLSSLTRESPTRRRGLARSPSRTPFLSSGTGKPPPPQFGPLSALGVGGLRAEHAPEGSATGEETFFQVDRGGCLVCSGTVGASLCGECEAPPDTERPCPPPHLGCGIVTCFDGKDSGFSLPPLVHLIVSSRWPGALPTWAQGAAE